MNYAQGVRDAITAIEKMDPSDPEGPGWLIDREEALDALRDLLPDDEEITELVVGQTYSREAINRLLGAPEGCECQIVEPGHVCPPK